jgi:hypothetical protein
MLFATLTLSSDELLTVIPKISLWLSLLIVNPSSYITKVIYILNEETPMQENWLIKIFQTSKIFRLSIEILISIVFFSWLPLIPQILAALVLSLLCEIVFAKNLTQNLKIKFSREDISTILTNSKKGKL